MSVTSANTTSTFVCPLYFNALQQRHLHMPTNASKASVIVMPAHDISRPTRLAACDRPSQFKGRGLRQGDAVRAAPKHAGKTRRRCYSALVLFRPLRESVRLLLLSVFRLPNSSPLSSMPVPTRTSATSTEGGPATPASPAVSISNYLSVGSVVMHDNVRCDILRSPIHLLGSKSLAPDHPSFAMSRLALLIRFVQLDATTNSVGKEVPTTSYLEYIDARIHLSDSMHPPAGDTYFDQPLHLSDSLSVSGNANMTSTAESQNYERISRAGSALVEDLKRANENREECPKPRVTGGFIVKEGAAPVVGMLGAHWFDEQMRPSTARAFSVRSSSSASSVKSASSARLPGSTFPGRRPLAGDDRIKSSSTAASAPLEPIHESHSVCSASHWEGEPSGSGTEDIIFQLKPLTRCSKCGERPLSLIHIAAGTRKPANDSTTRTPTSLRANLQMLGNQTFLPVKSFKLLANLISMDNDPDPLEEFFAHFKITFYFTDDRTLSTSGSSEDEKRDGEREAAGAIDGLDSNLSTPRPMRCCVDGKHTFRASIKIGKEWDAKLKEKKDVDFGDALARLEGKKRPPKIGNPTRPQMVRRLQTK